jgi:hypothetical protein
MTFAANCVQFADTVYQTPESFQTFFAITDVPKVKLRNSTFDPDI